MRQVTKIQTDSGQVLLDPNDGFVHCGVLFKGDGEGGLIGDAHMAEALNSIVGPEHWHAYTVFEFLDALCLDPQVFKQYYESKQPKIRGMTP